MNQSTGTIAPETISLSDHDGLVRWLVAAAKRLDSHAVKKALRRRLDHLFAQRRALLA